MANTNVSMRIDETLKAQLQELMSNLYVLKRKKWIWQF